MTNIRAKVTTNHRRYTDLYRATSSEWNVSFGISDVSPNGAAKAIIELPFAFVSQWVFVRNCRNEHAFQLQFLIESLQQDTFETEVKGNSEMANWARKERGLITEVINVWTVGNIYKLFQSQLRNTVELPLTATSPQRPGYCFPTLRHHYVSIWLKNPQQRPTSPKWSVNFAQAGRWRFKCINFPKIFYAFGVNITSFIGRDINNVTIGTSLDGEYGCLYGIHGIFLQPCQCLLDDSVIRSCSSFSRAVYRKVVNPNSRIHNISFKHPEDVFAEDSIQLLWRVGLELDRNWCGACVVCGHVCRREVWSWVLKNAKIRL